MSGARKVCTAFGLLAVASAWAPPSAWTSERTPVDASFAGRWFSPGSPWNTPISQNTETLSGSEGFVAAFQDGAHGININSETWTPAVLYADADLPRCTMSESGWVLEGLPLHPDFARTLQFFADQHDGDASFCIYSETNKAFYNLYGARAVTVGGARRLVVGAMGLFPLRGSGWWMDASYPWTGRASGASYCGGLVRLSEYNSGEINHALSIGWPKNLIRAPRMPSPYVFPARTSDGSGRSARAALPMGARLQLDPALSNDQLIRMGVKTADLPITRAMQRYGAYVVDSTDGVMAIYVESDRGKKASTTSSGPLPLELLQHAKFVKPPEVSPLDTHLTAGQPIFLGAIAAALRNDCILPKDPDGGG